MKCLTLRYWFILNHELDVIAFFFFIFFEESWIPGIGIKSTEIRGVNFPLSLSFPD